MFSTLERITLEKCKAYLRKKEEEDEIAELDTSNIITQGKIKHRFHQHSCPDH